VAFREPIRGTKSGALVAVYGGKVSARRRNTVKLVKTAFYVDLRPSATLHTAITLWTPQLTTQLSEA
jgi:hypothetical protein